MNLQLTSIPVFLLLFTCCNATKKISSSDPFINAREDEVITVLIDLQQRSNKLTAKINSIVQAPGTLKPNSDPKKSKDQLVCLWKDANENTLFVTYMDDPLNPHLEVPNETGEIQQVKEQISEGTGVARLQYVPGLSFLMLTKQDSDEPIALLPLLQREVKK